MAGKCKRVRDYIHCRVTNPKKFDPDSFRVKTISEGQKITVGCPKGHWTGKRCNVGMQQQNIMYTPEAYAQRGSTISPSSKSAVLKCTVQKG